MMRLSLASYTLLLALFAESVAGSTPLIMFSHKLVPRLQDYVQNFNHLPFPLERVQEVTRKLIEPCTSEAYVLVNQPGVTVDDLQDPSVFVFLRTYMFMSSTLAVIPRAEEVQSFDVLSEQIQRKCDAQEVIVEEEYGEVETYIDSTKRVIRINFPELPTDETKRKDALILSDDALRRTLRKLPSPHTTVIYTSLKPKVLNKRDEKRWANLDVFPDITKDASRGTEFERNNNVKEEERYFPKKRTGLIDRSLFEGSSFIDPELIYENELLILGIVLLTAVLILHQLVKLLMWLVTMAFMKNHEPTETKTGNKVEKRLETKKTK